MSKIQFNELNNASIEVLNEQETTQVVGGLGDLFNLKDVDLSQTNINGTIQVSDAFFAGSNGNSNATAQSNGAIIGQTL